MNNKPYEAIDKMNTDDIPIVARVIATNLVKNPDGTEHVIETLSDGRQVLAHVVKPE